eukprot:TRINITY_DN41219_c0_g1_i1.p1 TRINITY_DN41219_c0_g1~~TRINITY_DN41219_c0_g1_i1.p1  ORF type:complete len:318 (-),score=24.73 TRINITY_DN41219_c0_g1_i1:101-1054(-)
MLVGVPKVCCIRCRRKHHAQFYRIGLDSDEPYGYCKTTLNTLTYQQQIAPQELFHSAWGKIKNADHLVLSLHLRADLHASASQDTMVQDRKYAWSTLAHRIYFNLYAFSLTDWPCPMASLWQEMRHTKPSQMTPELWSNGGKKIEAEFSNMRVQRGILMRGESAGLNVLVNPSSQDGAMEDFERYCNDAPAVVKAAQEIAKVVTPPPRQIEISMILHAMTRASSRAASGQHDYRNVRVARAIIFMLRLRPAESEDDWQYYRSTSTSISSRMKSLGIWTFGGANKTRDANRAHSSEDAYNLGDLACLVCLMKYTEDEE